MLFILEDNTHIDGTVKVQSRERTDQETSTNIFSLDYEDFILLRNYHFYYHNNGNFICTFDKRQTYLNRILAWKRGFYDLYKRPTIVIKPENKSKYDFSKNNLVYYFTEECKPLRGVEKLTRGVIADDHGKYLVQIPIMCADHTKSFLHTVDTSFNTLAQARMMYVKMLKASKGEDYLKWI